MENRSGNTLVWKSVAVAKGVTRLDLSEELDTPEGKERIRKNDSYE